MSYWVAKLDDGTDAIEGSDDWTAIRDRVVELRLNVNGRWHELPSGMESYVQAKTMSSIVGSGEVNMESRYIGFLHGNYEYCLRVDMLTDRVNIETRKVI